MIAKRLAALLPGTDVRSVAAAIASITVVGAGLGLTGPLLSLLMEREGISTSLIGTNAMLAGLGSLITVPFVTPIARKYGVVNVMSANSLIAAAAMMALYYTDPLPYWFIIRLIFSINLCFLFVLSEFWINHAAGEANRGLVLGIYGTVLSLGFATGPAIITLVGTNGIAPFAIGSVIFVLATAPIWWAKDGEPLLQKSEKTPPILPYLVMVPMSTAAAFVFGAVEQTQFALQPVFATRSGYTEESAAILLTVMLLGNVFFQIPLGLWSDSVSDRRKPLLVCAVIGMTGSLLLPYATGSILLAYGLVFLWGGVIGGLYTIGLAHLGSRLKGTDLAQANAAFVMCYSIGLTVGPQLVGMSMDQFGISGFGLSIAGFFAAYILLYLQRVGFR